MGKDFCTQCLNQQPLSELEFKLDFEQACAATVHMEHDSKRWFHIITKRNIINNKVRYVDCRLPGIIGRNVIDPTVNLGSKIQGKIIAVRPYHDPHFTIMITVLKLDNTIHEYCSRDFPFSSFSPQLHIIQDISWEHVRLLFIGFYEKDCILSILPYEILHYLLQFLLL